MDGKETGLEYLELLISSYIEHEDKGMVLLIRDILRGIERMKACA